MERNEIEEARRKQGMTYQELSDKTGISVSTVQRYCRNEVKSPSVDVMNALHGAFETDTEETNVCEKPAEGDYRREVVDLLEKRHKEEIERIIADKDRQILRIRVEKYICAAIAVIMAAIFVGMTIYDNTHLDRGWIRHENTEYITDTK